MLYAGALPAFYRYVIRETEKLPRTREGKVGREAVKGRVVMVVSAFLWRGVSVHICVSALVGKQVCVRKVKVGFGVCACGSNTPAQPP